MTEYLINTCELNYNDRKYFNLPREDNEHICINCGNEIAQDFVRNMDNYGWMKNALNDIYHDEKVELRDFMIGMFIKPQYLKLFNNAVKALTNTRFGEKVGEEVLEAPKKEIEATEEMVSYSEELEDPKLCLKKMGNLRKRYPTENRFIYEFNNGNYCKKIHPIIFSKPFTKLSVGDSINHVKIIGIGKISENKLSFRLYDINGRKNEFTILLNKDIPELIMFGEQELETYHYIKSILTI